MNRKELLTENRKAFRFLHDAMGFDFQRDCLVIKGEGRFTYNTVCKEIERHISGDYAAAVLMKRSRSYMRDAKLYCVWVGLGRFNIARVDNLAYYDNNMDNFYNVGDFEEARKTQTNHYYIVAQKREHLNNAKLDNSVDLSQRFRYIPYSHEKHGDGRGHTYIGEVHLMMLDGSAREFTYKPYEGMYYYGEVSGKAATVGEVVDKSGYIVIDRRRDLKRRARKLRADRAAAAARVADFSDREKAIADRIEAAKGEVSARVLACATYGDTEKIEDAWRAFRNAVYYFKRYQEWRDTGRFADVAGVERALNEIAAYLDKVSENLK